MTVSITLVNNGTTAGDGTGENAFNAFESVNSNFTNLQNAVEALHTWPAQTGAYTLVIGEHTRFHNHVGVAATCPVTFAVDDAFIVVWNDDDASNVTLTPASGDQFYRKGTGLGVDATIALAPGEFAYLSPRTANSEWDVIILTDRDHTHTESDITDLGSYSVVGHTHTLSAITDSGALAALNTVGTTQIDNNAVTLAKLQDATAGYTILAKVGTGTGDFAELVAGADGVLRRSGSGDIAFGAIVTNNITNAAVTYAKLQDVAGISVIGRAANTSGVPAAITAVTDGHVLRLSGTTLGFGTIATAGIADEAVTLAKLSHFAAYTLLMRNGATTDDPAATKISALTEETDPTQGDKLLMEEAGGALRYMDFNKVHQYAGVISNAGNETGVLSDAGTLQRQTSASANSWTIPANSSVAYPIGTRIDVMQYGAGQTTIGITTDTLRGNTKVAGQYNVISLIKIASTEWVAVGGVA